MQAKNTIVRITEKFRYVKYIEKYITESSITIINIIKMFMNTVIILLLAVRICKDSDNRGSDKRGCTVLQKHFFITSKAEHTLACCFLITDSTYFSPSACYLLSLTCPLLPVYLTVLFHLCCKPLCWFVLSKGLSTQVQN